MTRSASSLQGNDLLLDALSQAHRFSKDDLSTNQQGSLSGGQVLRLIGFAIGQGALLLLSVGFGVWMYFIVPMKGDDQIWMIVLGLFVVIFALVMVWNIFKTFLDLLSRSVADEEGYVIRTEHRTRNGRYYTYQIKSLKLKFAATCSAPWLIAGNTVSITHPAVNVCWQSSLLAQVRACFQM